MEVDGRTDALIARDRCLAAVSSAKDLEEGQAIWRAALKYNGRMKEEREAGDYGSPLHARVGLGETAGGAREWV